MCIICISYYFNFNRFFILVLVILVLQLQLSTDIRFSVVAATDIYSKLTHKIEIKMTKYQFNNIRLSLNSKLSIMPVKTALCTN